MRGLIEAVRAQFALDWGGIHGITHWARVRRLGRWLAAQTGARADVVELFAFLHDARRLDDGRDPDHGRRGVELAARLRGACFELDDAGFELLCDAMERHSDGQVDGDVTVQACWDADRLDLGRIDVRPHGRLLCTEPAQRPETIDRAWASSQAWAAWWRSVQRS